ncbi:NADP-dependent oxidoreductase [Hoyosella altamirensis]|uniref:Enoyl reductase (ER) domain-containing protein n=1 Tax=Hoyosella altamirensis TaxID=616997 RepID=A0A839RII7_9ACTN|nr:NADP-dependent oxidoreductase [Hoyosella altamirensis]MBB3036475.1 hypothetical protein [Hoyosella altamirensis]
MAVTSREVHLVSRPSGEPAPENFTLVTSEVRSPSDGQVLVRNNWLSVDPYMRGRMNDVKSYVAPFQLNAPLEGGAVGTVIESRAGDVPVGATVLHFAGWREYALVDAPHVQQVDGSAVPLQTYLGPAGMPGLTAYAGLTRIAPVRDGDVVFISAAAGAVGTVAGRIARHLGAAKVIGSAGGPTKAQRLVSDFGFDTGIDYRAGNLDKHLREAAPDGIDVYFDNVGGEHLRAAIATMRDNGRIAMCGAISHYNDAAAGPGPDNLMQVISKRLTVRGFIVSDHKDLAADFTGLASSWIGDGSLRTPETVAEGIDNAVDAFLGLLRGANTGKMLIRL